MKIKHTVIQSFTMDRPGTSCKTKGSLGEQEISDLFSDELSQVPSESNSDIDSGSDWGKNSKFVPSH
jgi:hypothetical protein